MQTVQVGQTVDRSDALEKLGEERQGWAASP